MPWLTSPGTSFSVSTVGVSRSCVTIWPGRCNFRSGAAKIVRAQAGAPVPRRPELLAAYCSGRIHSKFMIGKRVRADLALGFCALIWGSTFVVVKNALADSSVFVYIAIRFALAAMVMAGVFWRSLRVCQH